MTAIATEADAVIAAARGFLGDRISVNRAIREQHSRGEDTTTPTLPDAVAALVSAGAREVTVWPMFLGTGRHAREDLPLLMDELRAAHPAVHFTLHAAIAEHPDVLQAMALAALGAPAGSAPQA